MSSWDPLAPSLKCTHSHIWLFLECLGFELRSSSLYSKCSYPLSYLLCPDPVLKNWKSHMFCFFPVFLSHNERAGSKVCHSGLPQFSPKPRCCFVIVAELLNVLASFTMKQHLNTSAIFAVYSPCGSSGTETAQGLVPQSAAILVRNPKGRLCDCSPTW